MICQEIKVNSIYIYVEMFTSPDKGWGFLLWLRVSPLYIRQTPTSIIDYSGLTLLRLYEYGSQADRAGFSDDCCLCLEIKVCKCLSICEPLFQFLKRVLLFIFPSNRTSFLVYFLKGSATVAKSGITFPQ